MPESFACRQGGFTVEVVVAILIDLRVTGVPVTGLLKAAIALSRFAR